MKFFKNITLMLLVNVAIVVTISIVLNLLGIQPMRYGSTYDMQSLLAFCFVWGMVGSFMSLLLSKRIAKWMMNIQIVDPQSAQGTERRVYDIVRRAAERAGLPCTPEVGLYESPEMNAFATGPSRGNALVAVSTGLVSAMSESELEGVLGHEVSHIANGDMVTMTLLQGVVNSLVMFLARIVAQIVSGAVEERSRRTVRFLVVILSEIVFGLVGVMITSWFSRRREYRADAGGARLMGREKMVGALEALRDRQRVFDQRAPELQAFKISGRTSGWRSFMMSHPPLEERIEALRRGTYAAS
ncbi:MAG: protease HtpX [Bdellovibrionales bacterium]|nr:protease HtpX [Bdellovibrionales bacterium]